MEYTYSSGESLNQAFLTKPDAGHQSEQSIAGKTVMSAKPTRVLQVNKLYSPWIGGVETVAEYVAEYLAGREETEVTNLVCQPLGRRSVDIVKGVKTYRAASWGILSGMPLSVDFFFLFRKLAAQSDLIILHHPFPLAFVAYRLFGRNKALIVWYHSDIVKQTVSRIPFLPFISFALRQAHTIIVSNRSIIASSLALKNFKTKCKVIYFGVDTAGLVSTVEVKSRAEAIRKAYGSPLVLSVGRLVYYKGYKYLIEAMSEVPEAKLLIVGKGKLRKELEGQIERLGLSARVHILDPVVDLSPYYHACDVFVLPSCEPSEVFGLVQIEAMACGKPVVNTALPTGVPEVSVDGRTGKTVPPKSSAALAEAIQAILTDREMYARFSKNALDDVARRFTKESFFAAMKTALL